MKFDYGSKAASVIPIEKKPNSKAKSRATTKAKKGAEAIKGELPKMPADMKNPIARRTWKALGPIMEEAGLISNVDLSVYRRYCENYALYVEATIQCMEKGEYNTTPNGYQQLAPWAISRDRHQNALHKCEAKLLLTPDARIKARISVEDAGDDLDLD